MAILSDIGMVLWQLSWILARGAASPPKLFFPLLLKLSLGEKENKYKRKINNFKIYKILIKGKIGFNFIISKKYEKKNLILQFLKLIIFSTI